jgi:hypothetical protein
MRTVKIGLLFLIPLMLIFRLAVGQTSTAVPKITDLFSADEMKKAGLSKLNPDEIAALNAAFFRILIQLNSDSELHTATSTASGSGSKDADFYDSRGRAVAYIAGDRDLTIFLWTGEPVAYLDEDSVYGFNGKHLGWLKSGAIYDHDGNMVAALSDRFKEPVTTPPPKSFEQFLPFKSFKEFKPFKPFFNLEWAEVPARIFFLGGAQ